MRSLLLAALVVSLVSLSGCADSFVGEDPAALASASTSDFVPFEPREQPPVCRFTILGPGTLAEGTVGTYQLIPAGVCDVTEVAWYVLGNGTVLTDTDGLEIQVRAGKAPGFINMNVEVWFNGQTTPALVHKRVQVGTSPSQCDPSSAVVTGASAMPAGQRGYFSLDFTTECEPATIQWSIQGNGRIQRVLPLTRIRVFAGTGVGPFTLTVSGTLKDGRPFSASKTVAVGTSDLNVQLRSFDDLETEVTWTAPANAASCAVNRTARGPGVFDAESWNPATSPLIDVGYFVNPSGSLTLRYIVTCQNASGITIASETVSAQGSSPFKV